MKTLLFTPVNWFAPTFAPLMSLMTILILTVSCIKSNDSNVNANDAGSLPFNNFKNLDWSSVSFELEIPADSKFDDGILLEYFSPTAPNTAVIWLKVPGNQPEPTANNNSYVWVPQLQARYRPLLAQGLLDWWRSRHITNPITNQPLPHDEDELVLISYSSPKAFQISVGDLLAGKRPFGLTPGPDYWGRNQSRTISREADLRGANLTYANLTGANLTGANLTHANMKWANLTGADLTGAILEGADLRDANLTGAHLNQADLTRADLTRANLTRANLTGALLREGNFDGTVFSLSTVVRGAKFYKSLHLPLSTVFSLRCRGAEFFHPH